MLKQMLQDYAIREWGEDFDFSGDLTHLGVMYGEDEEGRHELEVYFDIVNFKEFCYIDGVLVSTLEHPSEQAMYDTNAEATWSDYYEVVWDIYENNFV